jgi:putative Holliday junction resolvase
VDSERPPPGERVCALDYGLSRIGVAIEDELGLLAHPRPFVAARPEAVAMATLMEFLRAEQVTKVLVGLPTNMDGTLGVAARGAKKFGSKLGAMSGLVVEFVDERLTTVQAYALLRESGRDAKKAKAHVDSASACILLQSHLDARKFK